MDDTPSLSLTIPAFCIYLRWKLDGGVQAATWESNYSRLMALILFMKLSYCLDYYLHFEMLYPSRFAVLHSCIAVTQNPILWTYGHCRLSGICCQVTLLYSRSAFWRSGGMNHTEPQRFASVKIQPLTSLAPAPVRGIYERRQALKSVQFTKRRFE